MSDATTMRADSELWTASWAPEERADTEYWTLRACGGVTGRANSAVPRAGAIRDPSAALTQLESFYRSRGLRAQVQLPARFQETSIGVTLRAAGYTPAFPTLVQALALSDKLITGSYRKPAELSFSSPPEPTPAWRELYISSDGRGDPALDERQLAILTRTPSNYLELRSNDQLLGIARLTMIGAASALTGMVVDAQQRGKGLGRLVLSAVIAHAHASGCTQLALQVTEANLVAQRLYSGAGFRTVDSYEYQLAPQ